MAVGDDATAAGFPLVPNTGEDGRVRYGAREINRSRDYVANVQSLIPISPDAYRIAAGISAGTTDPVNSDGAPDGTVYFKTL